MRVGRLYASGDLRLADEPIPEPREGESLVRVTAVGLCGSDLHWYGEGQIGEVGMSGPLVLGHEFAGVVEGGPLHGLRVAADPAVPCGQCSICRGGDHNLCPNVRFAGHGEQDGALREYVTWPAHLLHELSDGIDDAGGAVLEPLGVALHAMNLAHLQPGATVAVVGTGPLGLLMVQLSRTAGAGRIIAIEPIELRRAAALACGADHSIGPEETRDDGIRELAGDWGVDVAFEVAGNNDAVGIALDAVRPGGRLVFVGIPGDDHLTLSAAKARRKGVTLVFVRRMQDLYERAIRLVTRGAIDLDAVVSHHFELENVDEAFKFAVTRQGLKVIVHP